MENGEWRMENGEWRMNVTSDSSVDWGKGMDNCTRQSVTKNLTGKGERLVMRRRGKDDGRGVNYDIWAK